MDERLQSLINKANNGDVNAMVIVGDCYNRGEYIEKNVEKAQQYYMMAAEKGNAQAEFMAGLGFLLGEGVGRSVSTEAKYIQSAADKGITNAQYVLGSLYKDGEIGFWATDQKAVKYFEMAAKHGHAQAQIELGDMYIRGVGVKTNLNRGLFWLVCAYLHGQNAMQESDDAMERINTLIYSGLPGGKERIDSIIDDIKANYSLYIKNNY